MPRVAIQRCDPHAALDLGERDGEGFEGEIHVDRDIIVFFGMGHEHFSLPASWPGDTYKTHGAACDEIKSVVNYVVDCFDIKA